MSIVRENLMTREGYAPYCGWDGCRTMPRTHFINGQFQCPSCGWRSEFDPEFVAAYRAKWSLPTPPSRGVGGMKLSKAQLDVLSALAEPHIVGMSAYALGCSLRTIAVLTRLGYAEHGDQNDVTPSTRNVLWSVTDAGRAALKDTTHAE